MDTKGIEFSFIKSQIASTGVSTCVINTGILGEPQLTPDISADEVAQAGGSSLQALRDEGDRGEQRYHHGTGVPQHLLPRNTPQVKLMGSSRSVAPQARLSERQRCRQSL